MTRSAAQIVRDRTADPKKVTLRKAGFIDNCGVVTREGRFALRALLLEKFEDELVTLANEVLADDSGTVGNSKKR